MKYVDDGMPERNGWTDPVGDIQAMKDKLATLPNEYGTHLTIEWITLPVADLPQLVADYVKLIELGETTTAGCKCQWIVHPDDVDKPDGQRRIRKGDASLKCPVHTKEGFLLGFFAWLNAEPVPLHDLSLMHVRDTNTGEILQCDPKCPAEVTRD